MHTACVEVHRKGGPGGDARSWCAGARNSRLRGIEREAEAYAFCTLTHGPNSDEGGLTWMLFSCRFR